MQEQALQARISPRAPERKMRTKQQAAASPSEDRPCACSLVPPLASSHPSLWRPCASSRCRPPLELRPLVAVPSLRVILDVQLRFPLCSEAEGPEGPQGEEGKGDEKSPEKAEAEASWRPDPNGNPDLVCLDALDGQEAGVCSQA